MLESQDIEDREAIPRAENLLLSLEELLAAGLHIGTRIKTVDMERYIFRVRPDGLFILNIGETNEKIRIAARFMGRFDPGRVLAVSSRLYGKTHVEKFAEITRTVPIVGRFMPGLISNPLQPHHAEPQVVLVTDPRADWQAIKEATSVGVPVIALCDTDNIFAGVDFVIPVNNKGRRALAVVYWLLARQVLRERGELPQDGTIPLTVDDFETKLAAMPMGRASGGEARKHAHPHKQAPSTPTLKARFAPRYTTASCILSDQDQYPPYPAHLTTSLWRSLCHTRATITQAPSPPIVTID